MPDTSRNGLPLEAATIQDCLQIVRSWPHRQSVARLRGAAVVVAVCSLSAGAVGCSGVASSAMPQPEGIGEVTSVAPSVPAKTADVARQGSSGSGANGASGAGGGRAEQVAPVTLPAAGRMAAEDARRDMPEDDAEADAGTAVLAAQEVNPTCEQGVWKLAAGLWLSEPVEYVADRLTDPTLTVYSSAGVPCGGARDRDRCLSNLNAEVATFTRHLVTTSGDTVRIWQGQAALTLLGRIDTKAEALWFVLSMSGLSVPCSVEVRKSGEDFVFEAAPPANTYPSCGGSASGGPAKLLRVVVHPDGTYELPDGAGAACVPVP